MTLPDPRSLLYRQLDPAEAQAITRQALSACDDGELFLQFTASETFAFDDGRQISEILGTSVGALKASYHHAVKKIEAFVTAN